MQSDIKQFMRLRKIQVFLCRHFLLKKKTLKNIYFLYVYMETTLLTSISPVSRRVCRCWCNPRWRRTRSVSRLQAGWERCSWRYSPYTHLNTHDWSSAHDQCFTQYLCDARVTYRFQWLSALWLIWPDLPWTAPVRRTPWSGSSRAPGFSTDGNTPIRCSVNTTVQNDVHCKLFLDILILKIYY